MKNNYRIENGVVFMECTFEGRTVEAMFDEDKLSIAESYPLTWYVKRSSKTCCYVTGISTKEGKQTVTYLHRLLTNCPDNMVVDHIDHNTLDNRLENLRVVTRKANIQNFREQKGITYREDLGKWVVRMQANGKQMHLGCFLDYDDALVARKNAEEKYWRNS
jgi:hypothetical protein